MNLHLTIATPLRIVLDEDGVASLRAEDASGDFGIRPGHADFLTVIDAGVLRWRAAAGPWRYAVVRGGVLIVAGGSTVAVACREAIFGDDLATLQARVLATRAEQEQDARHARTQDAQLHARAIRRMMMQLAGGREDLSISEDIR